MEHDMLCGDPERDLAGSSVERDMDRSNAGGEDVSGVTVKSERDVGFSGSVSARFLQEGMEVRNPNNSYRPLLRKVHRRDSGSRDSRGNLFDPQWKTDWVEVCDLAVGCYYMPVRYLHGTQATESAIKP